MKLWRCFGYGLFGWFWLWIDFVNLLGLWVFVVLFIMNLIQITLEIMWHESASQNKTLRCNGSTIVFRSMPKLSNFQGNCEMLDSTCKNFAAQKNLKKQDFSLQHYNNEFNNLPVILIFVSPAILRQQCWCIYSFLEESLPQTS